MCMKIIPAQHFSFDLVHSLSGINLGFYLYGSLFLGGGGGEVRLFYSLGRKLYCIMGKAWGEVHRFGGGGSFPCAPRPLGLISDCLHWNSSEKSSEYTFN